MARFRAAQLLVTVLLGAVGTLAACRGAQSPHTPEGSVPISAGTAADGGTARLYDDERPTGRLVAFKDEAEMKAYGESWKEQLQNGGPKPHPFFPMGGPKGPKGGKDDLDAGPPPQATVVVPKPPKPPSFSPPSASPAPAASSPAPARPRAAAPAAKAEAAASSVSKPESITNNQNAAVDEGDIVKLHGDHLVVLRRGRLFTISLKDETKARFSEMHDAFGPNVVVAAAEDGVADKGDSGGPLFCAGHVIGVASCHRDGEGDTHRLELYARIDEALPWIETVLARWR
jgi:hypothetical protein